MVKRKAAAHDRAFRGLLREPGVADALVREHLPRATLRVIGGPAQLVPGSFIDDALREHLTDVLVRVPLRGRRGAFLYVLIEHKRAVGRDVAFQVLRYLAQIYERLARQQRRGRVPCVVPLIVFNGQRPWRGPRAFRDVIEQEGRPRGALDFSLRVLDVTATPADRLARHRLLRGGLLGLKVATARPAQQARLIVEVHRSIRDPSTRRRFVQYIGTVADQRAVRAAETMLAAEQETTMETFAEYHQRLGRRKGRTAGRSEGRAEGRAEGLRQGVEAILRLRFKRLPATATRRLEKATEQQLTTWLSRAPEAPSLNAVFDARR